MVLDLAGGSDNYTVLGPLLELIDLIFNCPEFDSVLRTKDVRKKVMLTVPEKA